jgi:hypothetical protein
VVSLKSLGTTILAPTIAHYLKHLKGLQETAATTYHTLLILIDQAIGDYEDLKELLREASDYPLSIIFVGLGSSQFGSMDKLEETNLTNTTISAKSIRRSTKPVRPLTQFLKSSDYGDIDQLAYKALSNVKEQFLRFYRQKEAETYCHLVNVNPKLQWYNQEEVLVHISGDY